MDRRLQKTLFKEAYDYAIIKNDYRKTEGARESTDYYMTIEMAKYLAMMENTNIGYAVRQKECSRNPLNVGSG